MHYSIKSSQFFYESQNKKKRKNIEFINVKQVYQASVIWILIGSVLLFYFTDPLHTSLVQLHESYVLCHPLCSPCLCLKARNVCIQKLSLICGLKFCFIVLDQEVDLLSKEDIIFVAIHELLFFGIMAVFFCCVGGYGLDFLNFYVFGFLFSIGNLRNFAALRGFEGVVGRSWLIMNFSFFYRRR